MRDRFGDWIALVRELQRLAQQAFEDRRTDLVVFIEQHLVPIRSFPYDLKDAHVRIERVYEPRAAGDGIAAKVEVLIRATIPPHLQIAGQKEREVEFTGVVHVQAYSDLHKEGFQIQRFQPPALLVECRDWQEPSGNKGT